jgi:NAD(P)-dependent dehydrogenase (short-subunit alcohol dehydrogenase family)
VLRRAGQQRRHRLRHRPVRRHSRPAPGSRSDADQPVRRVGNDACSTPLLRAAPHPRVVNVSSQGGSLASMGAGAPSYHVTKAALNALTITLAAELRGDRVLVNSARPSRAGVPGAPGASDGECRGGGCAGPRGPPPAGCVHRRCHQAVVTAVITPASETCRVFRRGFVHRRSARSTFCVRALRRSAVTEGNP